MQGGGGVSFSFIKIAKNEEKVKSNFFLFDQVKTQFAHFGGPQKNLLEQIFVLFFFWAPCFFSTAKLFLNV